MQRGIFVFGAETDFTFSNMKGTTIESPIIQNNGTPFFRTGNNLTVHQNTDWFGTLRLRVGIAAPAPRLLVYATGGLAYGRVHDSANTNFGFPSPPFERYPADIRKTKAGWTAGAGTELAIDKHWSLKLEYLYYDLGSESATANPSIPFGPGVPAFQVTYKWKTSADTVNFGVNYRF